MKELGLFGPRAPAASPHTDLPRSGWGLASLRSPTLASNPIPDRRAVAEASRYRRALERSLSGTAYRPLRSTLYSGRRKLDPALTPDQWSSHGRRDVTL